MLKKRFVSYKKTNAYLLLPDPHFCNNPPFCHQKWFSEQRDLFCFIPNWTMCCTPSQQHIHKFLPNCNTFFQLWYTHCSKVMVLMEKSSLLKKTKGPWPLKDVTIYHWIFYILWWPFLQGLLKFAYEFKLLKSAFPSISAFFGRVLKKQRKLRWWSAMWAFYSEFMIIVLVCISIKSMMHQFIKIKKAKCISFLSTSMLLTETKEN